MGSGVRLRVSEDLKDHERASTGAPRSSGEFWCLMGLWGSFSLFLGLGVGG